MKQTMTFLFAMFFTQYAFSQEKQNKYSFELGKVNQYELTMTEYEKDRAAEAVVIYEEGNFYFSGNVENRASYNFYYAEFLLNKNRKIKIKILKEGGLKQAEFAISLYNETEYSFEKLIISSASVYNLTEDNKIEKTEFDARNITEYRLNKNYVVKTFTLPNVKVGSVIEVEYDIVSPYIFSFEWSFQHRIPVIYNVLKYRAIPYYAYVYMLKGATKFDEFNEQSVVGTKVIQHLEYREKDYRIGMKNLPAFKDEEFITTPKDYIVSIDFQLSEQFFSSGGSKRILSTWVDLNNGFVKADNFGKYIKHAEKAAKKLLPTLNLTGETQEQTLENIVNYVKTNYRWNELYGKYVFSQMNEFLRTKSGNDANLNLFLIGLLRASGFDVVPVVLSTRENGTINKQYPFDKFFNYVIACVNLSDSIFYIDATDPMLPFNQLPERCLNVEGLVVKPQTDEWVKIEEKELSVIYNEFKINLLSDKNCLNADIKIEANAVNAYDFRKILSGKNERLIHHLKTKYGFEIRAFDISNAEKYKKPIAFSFTTTLPLKDEQQIEIHPFCQMSLSDNPFKLPSRTLPVDLIYRRAYKYKSVIQIPDDYKITSLPVPIDAKNQYYSLLYSVVQNGNTIEIEATFEFSKNIYQAKEYGYMRSCVNTVIKKLAEQVVLEKN
ncbi:MAG: DUF3858 domain-containing protein [Prevotellaceae bacterium]|jgi:hypothetical protein|nr:DUF3858 domain-containing protein [Prevotellaceae bacterium]